MTRERLDTFCGLYCGSCSVRLAKARGKLENVAKQWERDIHELLCNGCKTDTVSVFCRNCQIKHCAETQGVDYCYQCSTFPCEKIVAFKNDDRPHHAIVLANLSTMQEKGVNAWLEEQKVRWSCPQCNEEYSWYDAECSKCNEPVRNCLDDERELESEPSDTKVR